MSCHVLGAGLVGSYLGAAAGALWASRRHPDAIRERVRLPAGEVAWAPEATVPADALVLVAARCHQTPWSTLPRHSLAAQNGLGQPVPVAVCFMAVDRDADGVIAARGPTPRIVVGPLDAKWDDVLTGWRRAGLTVEQVDDPRPAQWEKAILNATVGPLCLATGQGMGAVWADTALRDLTLRATGEGAAIAAAAGIAIPIGLAERAARFFDCVGDHHPSVLADPGELPWILGPLLGVAQRHSLPVPALDRIVHLLAPHVVIDVAA